MRVSVSHNKTQEEAKKAVDRSLDDLFKGVATGPVDVTDVQRTWNGNVMDFSFTAKMGFFKTPLNGTITVDPRDIIIEVELPAFLKAIMPEEKLRAGIESKVKGLLT